MPHESPGKCPVCDSSLQIGRLVCPNCDTTVEGRFEPCVFCRMGKDYRAFAEVFIKCRGNIKEVEKELGISYPTVRNRLEQLLLVMNVVNNPTESDKDSTTSSKEMDILERVEAGELTVDEAVEMLKKPSLHTRRS